MRLSLKYKVVILIILIAVVIAASSIILSNRMFSNVIDKNYKSKATDLSSTVAVVLDSGLVKDVTSEVIKKYKSIDKKVGSEEWGSPEFNKYTAKYDSIAKSRKFIRLRRAIRKIQAVNEVDCIYLFAIDRKNKRTIYVVDAATEDACPPGCFDPLYDMNKKLLTDPTVGFPAYITNTEPYGWLVTAGSPIYDRNKKVICYAMVDISVQMIKAEQKKQLMTLILLEALLTLVICILAILSTNRTLVRPINKLKVAAEEYCNETDVFNRKNFSNVVIRTGDEIESLSESMKQMEDEMNSSMLNLLDLSDELSKSREHADKMTNLARKDALTGIRNKLSYNENLAKLDEQRKQGLTRFGILVADLNNLKKINDTYGHEKGDVAIINLSNMICDQFVHSQVFRIGGDEFAIILLNQDFDNVEALLTEFYNKLDALHKDPALDPWEKFSASLGYAIYNPSKDDNVKDVFNRADRIMYEYKKKMKEGRKD